MQVNYMGESLHSLGVNVPNEAPILCGFSYGVRFRKYAPSSLVKANWSLVFPDREDDADVLVLEPGEWDDFDEIIVVVVNQRCLQNHRFSQWLKHALTVDPEGFSSARVFVPEKRPARPGASRALGKTLRRECVDAEVFPYYPELVD